MIRNIALFLFLSVSTLPAVAQKTTQSSEQPVFTVDNKPVTVNEFVYLYKKNHQPKKAEYTREKMDEYLELFINFKLKVAEAMKRGIDTTAVFKKEFNTYHDELRKPYLPDAGLVDSLVALTYQRLKEEINASHILIGTGENPTPETERAALQKILGIRERALKGESFEALAASFSDDPSVKINQGNLGYFTALQMVYPFEMAAYQTPEGGISEPVKTQFGYHILKINDRRPSSGEVEVSHILLRTGENKDNAEAKNKAFEIYDQLQSGVSWDELCKQYSEDPSSKDIGGKLRPFGVGVMAALPEFERMAFELQKPGDYSDPFQTQYGWHLIRLERKIPLSSFEEMKTSLKNRVSRDERVQVSKQQVYDKLKLKYKFVENAQLREKIFASADTSLQKGEWKPTPELNSAAGEMLFSVNGSPVTAKDFLLHVRSNQKRSKLAPRPYMEQLYNGFAESRLIEKVESTIVATNPEYKWLLNEYYEGILLFDIMEKEIWNKASSDSIGQRAFYSKRPDAYRADERVEAEIYSSQSLKDVEQLRDAITAGDTAKREELIASQKIRREQGNFEKSDRIILSKVPWKTGVHIGENNNLHYLVNVKAMLPPGSKTFQEARAEVISDYQTYLEKEWIAKLRKTHAVKVNKKGRDTAFKILAEQKTE
jgi:peptidyl-prolyl cis-trans isomerase SurA